jgi:hypothetical protein
MLPCFSPAFAEYAKQPYATFEVKQAGEITAKEKADAHRAGMFNALHPIGLENMVIYFMGVCCQMRMNEMHSTDRLLVVKELSLPRYEGFCQVLAQLLQ